MVKQSEKGFQYLTELMQFGLLKKHIHDRPETLEQFTKALFQYLNIEFTQAYPSFPTRIPRDEEKDIINETINFLRELASTLEDEQTKQLREIF